MPSQTAIRLRLSVTVVASGLLLVGCKTARQVVEPTVTSCPQPPVTGVSSEDKAGYNLAAKLEQVGVGGEVKAEFERVVKADFATLSDRNVSLLLFLRAIDCYLGRGAVGEEIAREMAAMVRQEWAAQSGFRGTDGPLTPLEVAAINRSPQYGRDILEKLNRFAVGAPR
ncbi:MAG: hypothetical protein KF912_02655 [Phycisphaeraceae bacterium]|nr:hypothetical protein [Phycisphaeraceae bacterium]MBX3366200.1 hypothetical protein [Phycisphaeraceae bacterium]